MWQNSDSQRIDASYLFIMERPTEPWLQKQIDEESEFFNDIYQVSNMKIYNATSEGFNFAWGLNFSHISVRPPSPWNPAAQWVKTSERIPRTKWNPTSVYSLNR